MIALALSALIAVVAVATSLTLVDCWIRGRYMLEALREERALLDAGFVMMAQPIDPRPRKPVRFDALTTAYRAPSQRLSTDAKLPRRAAPGAV